MSSAPPPVESVQDIHVRLKPVLGVEPKHYLAVLYALALAAVLFALLVLPGLTNPGTKVTVESNPPGAAVTWGDKHWGTTPVTVFLPEGAAPLVVSKPGFTADRRDYRSGNQLFFSLFFPKSDTVKADLKPVSETSISDRYQAEIGRWALAVPFTSDYRFPPLFTRFAADAQAAGWSADQIRTFLLGFRSAVGDPQMYLDYGRALGLWPANASAPEGLEAQFGLWEPLTGSASGRLALWILVNQTKPVRDREVTEPSDWLKGKIAELTAGLKASIPVPTAAAPASLKTAFGSFRGVAPSAILWGQGDTALSLPTDPPFSLPVPVSVPAFWIAEREVTQGEYAEFAAAQPRWAPANRDALVEAGLADADYLASWKDGKPAAPAEPAASVSWFAAQAYADWLNASGKVPAGKKAVLPSEYQWEAAARAPGGASLLNQGVWEWTASAWYPAQALVWTGAETENETGAYARSLKGGIQAPKGSVKPGDRAGWPASGTTPGLGFRLALVGTP